MNNPTILVLFTLLYQCSTISTTESKFYQIRRWKYLNFTWPNDESLRTATANGDYIPENNALAGIKYHEDYFYLTVPRMKKGVPATLTRIKAGPASRTSPALEPFPSWEWNRVGDCNSLQNVQNVEVDGRGQMWVIDSGRVDTFEQGVGVKCSPKLVIFDLKTNNASLVYNFPELVASKNSSYLYDLVVDSTDGGFAYITDNGGKEPGIIVFSLKENRSWKIKARSMTADPSASEFYVNSISIPSPINVAGIALGPKIHTSDDRIVVNADRQVYFSPISSLHLFSINTTILRDENLTKNNFNYEDAIRNVGMKKSQSAAMLMDSQGILYYGLLGNDAIAKWDTHTPFETGQKVIAEDDTFIEWPNSFTLDRNGNLTVVVNRLNRFIHDQVDLNEYNYWLISSHVGGMSYLHDDDYKYDTAREPQLEPEPVRSTEETMRSSSAMASSPGMTESPVMKSSAPVPSNNRQNLTKATSGGRQVFVSVFLVVSAALALM